MKKYVSALVLGSVLLLSGCGSKDPEPSKTVSPYLAFDKGVVVSSQKVLIDGSYQTLLMNEMKTQTTGQIPLYKTTVFFKDKNYVVFVSKDSKVGSEIEFILKDDKLTNITF